MPGAAARERRRAWFLHIFACRRIHEQGLCQPLVLQKIQVKWQKGSNMLQQTGKSGLLLGKKLPGKAPAKSPDLRPVKMKKGIACSLAIIHENK
jgi:hypothetical protein